MKTIKLMTACAAAFLFASCLQVDEPESIAALRNAKAELIAAEAQYKLAEAAVTNASAAYQQALADYQLLENKLKELEVALQAATDEKAILELKNAIELLKLEHQANVFTKKQELAEAEQAYLDVLAKLAEEAKGISEGEQEILDGYLTKLSNLKNQMSGYQSSYETAVTNYVKAQHDFTFDFEMYNAKYLRDVAVGEKAVETAKEFQALLADVNGSDYVAALTELTEEIEKEEAALQILKNNKTIYEKENKNPLELQKDEIDNQTAQNNAKITDLETKQKHYYTDNEAFYKVKIFIPNELSSELYTWFSYYGYLSYTYGFVEDQYGEWTTLNNEVTVQFPFQSVGYNSVSNCLYNLENGLMAEFFADLLGYYEYWSTYEGMEQPYLIRRNYFYKVVEYFSSFSNAVEKAKSDARALDKEIYAIESAQLELDIEKSAVDIKISKVNVEVAALQKEIDDKEDALAYVKTLRDTYEGFVLGTKAVYPEIQDFRGNQLSIETFNPENGFVVIFKEGELDELSGDYDVVLKEWADLADFAVFYAEKNLARAQAMYEAYNAAESPMVVAQEAEVKTAEMEMTLAKIMYEYYKTQFELYTKLFNEFLAQVTTSEGETTTPPAEETPAA